MGGASALTTDSELVGPPWYQRTFMYVLVFPLLSVICAVNEMLEFQYMFYSTVNVSVHSSYNFPPSLFLITYQI